MITVLVPSPALDVTYLVDELRPGAIHRPFEVVRLAGGKGFNLARAALRLGEHVEVIAALGGPTGERVAELARGEGIRLTRIDATGETRTCVSVVGQEVTEINERAPASDLAALVRAAPSTSRLVVSGSVEGDIDALGGRVVAVDTSGAALAALVAHGADLVKVNRAEAAEAIGRDGTALELASALRERGIRTVVVTDGADGAVAIDAQGAWRAEPDPLRGRYTVGSGDSFFAGLLVAQERGQSLPLALRLASAAGSANTRRPGAGLFSRDDVQAAWARIRVTTPS
ncbi:MAG: PfkB family carbohydrate kinase [Microbacterium sp.]|uniref:1-phosphofructokinase family hexose kinase n=1 Tax=Microbacterium sp. TaxID=51671 RepID=UPI0039E65860